MAGGLVGSIIGGGGGILGSVLGGGLGNIFNSLSSIFGQDNILGGITNSLLGFVGDGLNALINASPFVPQFLKPLATDLVDTVIEGAKVDVPEAAQNAVDESFGDTIMNAAMDLVAELGSGADEEAKKGKNWLAALAERMGKIQAEHLNSAMDNLDTMEANMGDSDDARTAFTTAQAGFQADMKMFGMSAEATSTALKSIGEGMSSLARKQ